MRKVAASAEQHIMGLVLQKLHGNGLLNYKVVKNVWIRKQAKQC